MSTLSWSWLAGFFDGEGCVRVAKQNQRGTAWTVTLAFYQKEVEVLDDINVFLLEHGVTSICVSKKKSGQCVLEIQARKDVIFVLAKLVPRMHTKKKEIAAEGLEFLRATEKLVTRYGMHYRRRGVIPPVPPKQNRERSTT